MSAPICVVRDGSTHGGVLISTIQDGTVKLQGTPICNNGSLHSCPIPRHGTTPVTAITTITKVQGLLVLTTGAVAGCGALMTPPDRTVYAS
jgi:uncharacterized Zn-binding protein involved in type VI secretion